MQRSRVQLPYAPLVSAVLLGRARVKVSRDGHALIGYLVSSLLVAALACATFDWRRRPDTSCRVHPPPRGASQIAIRRDWRSAAPFFALASARALRVRRPRI